MKVWELSISVNDYSQHGAYTLGLFKDKPTLDKLRSLISCKGMSFPLQRGKSPEESLDILLRDGSLDEYATGGGDTWYLSEVEVY